MRRAKMRLARLMRRFALDRNDLRRTSDRIEAWGALVLILAFVPLAVLSASCAVGWVRAGAATAQRDGPLREVTAVLDQTVPPAAGAVPGSAELWAAARWTVSGSVHVGAVQAPPGTPAGTAVRIWVDAAGNFQPPPATAAQVSARVALVVMTTPLGVALGLWLAWCALRWVLDRRRLASWAGEWSSFGPSRTR
jgi:hypothetical protein